MIRPELGSALWVYREIGKVVHLELRALDLPADEFSQVDITTEYAGFTIRDAGTFWLPLSNRRRKSAFNQVPPVHVAEQVSWYSALREIRRQDSNPF